MYDILANPGAKSFLTCRLSHSQRKWPHFRRERPVLLGTFCDLKNILPLDECLNRHRMDKAVTGASPNPHP